LALFWLSSTREVDTEPGTNSYNFSGADPTTLCNNQRFCKHWHFCQNQRFSTNQCFCINWRFCNNRRILKLEISFSQQNLIFKEIYSVPEEVVGSLCAYELQLNFNLSAATRLIFPRLSEPPGIIIH
jgi:hypothetical protein